MTYCKRCGVTLRGGEESCVLCSSPCERVSKESERYYPAIKYSNRFRYVMKVLAMLSVVAVGLSLYIGRSTDTSVFWQLIVLGGTVYVWASFLTARKSLRNVGLMILIQLTAISLLGYLIDYSTGNHGWMINYVIPFMLIGAQGIVTAIMIARPLMFRDFMIYQFILGIMGALSVLFMVFGLARVHWPYITVFVYSLVILVGTAILADRKYKQELIKRFHF